MEEYFGIGQRLKNSIFSASRIGMNGRMNRWVLIVAVHYQLLKRHLRFISENPMHPSLRTKRIQGMDNLFECSVNMDIRVIWYYEDSLIIILLGVGRHDILKQF